MWDKVIGWKGGWKMSLWRTKYREELEEKPDKDALLEKRLEKCGKLCQLGIANLLWKGTTLVFKDMQAKKDPNLFYSIAISPVCLLCMVMGTIAAMFPDTAPAPCFMSGLGAQVAIVSMIGSYHLDLLAYFPSDLYCYTSMALTSATLTIYWAYVVQDPWIIHLVARLLNFLWDLLVYMWDKVIGWMGKGDAAMKKMKDFCGSRKGNKQD